MPIRWIFTATWVTVTFGIDTPIMQGAALVHIYTDGSVLLHHGGIDVGQGLYTKCIQVSWNMNMNVSTPCSEGVKKAHVDSS